MTSLHPTVSRSGSGTYRFNDAERAYTTEAEVLSEEFLLDNLGVLVCDEMHPEMIGSESGFGSYSRETLKALILLWVSEHPGVDQKDVADHFDITGREAVEMVGELLDQGHLTYDSVR